VITELPVGGAERCLTELAIGLNRRGFGVRVFSIGPPPAPSRDALVQRLHSATIPFHSLHASSAWAAPAALFRLRRFFLADRPDIVQTFLHHANVLGTLAARLAKVPTCVGGIRVAQPNRWRSLLERRAVAKMNAVICVSDAVEAFARQRIVPANIPTTVIPNGVDLRRFETAAAADWTRWGIPRDACVALYVGRLEPQKGLEQLFAAAESFLQDEPNRWLVLAGDGPELNWARSVCDRLPGKRAKCIGWQSDVAALLAAARMLLLTSRYEGMPNVVLEAMASARPVVCFAVEGIEQIFAPAAHLADRWQVIPVGDIERFSRAVSQFFSDEELRRTAGRQNRARVAERYSIDSMVDAYAAFYRGR
ncbi:MAG: glycosyltransferase, partial [Pirellulaceae bacterium]